MRATDAKVAVRATRTRESVDPRARPGMLQQAVNYEATDFLPIGRDCSWRDGVQGMTWGSERWAGLAEPLAMDHGNVGNADIHYSGPSFW